MGKRDNTLDREIISEQLALDGATKKILDFYQGRLPDIRLGESVQQLSKSLGMRDYEVAKRIRILQDASMIQLLDPAPPATIASYFISSYSLWFWALLVIVGLTVLAVYGGSGFLLVYSRYVLGSIFIFYLPGFSLIQLLYPKSNKISKLETNVISIGISLALVTIFMIMLSYTQWGISLTPLVALLCFFTIVFAAGAVIRKFGVWS